MTVTINLPPDVETRVQTEAAEQSLRVTDYMLCLITDAISAKTDAEEFARPLSPCALGSSLCLSSHIPLDISARIRYD